MTEVADVERGTNEQAPDNEGASGRGPGVRGQGLGRFLHGSLSLTLKYFLPAADLLHTVAQ